MKKALIIVFALTILALIALTVGGCPAPTSPTTPTATTPPLKTYEWKIQSEWPRGDLSLALLDSFADSVAKKSNGQMKITVFGEPEIVPMDQVIDACVQGTIEMMHGGGTVAQAIVPSGVVEFGLPYAYEIQPGVDLATRSAELRDWFFSSGYADIFRAEYAKLGLYYLDIHTYGPCNIFLSKTPITKIEDFKGLKVRSEGIWAEQEAQVGAIGTADIGPGDTYMGLKTGALDATVWDLSAITGLKWNEVAPYWVLGLETDCIGHIQVNMKAWNELPDNLKQVLREAAEEYWYTTVDGYGQEVQTVENMVKTGDVKTSQLDDNALQTLHANAYILWDEVAKQDAASAKAVKLLKEWRGIE
jgi:TRAP-type mannitol/chloroaromatic compound transport system substrate-binding protein